MKHPPTLAAFAAPRGAVSRSGRPFPTDMRTRIALLPLAAVVFVAGCATMPSGPNVMVLPGPQKSFDQFQADQGSCQNYAMAVIGGTSAQQNAANNAAANVAIGTALGAAAGAIIGAATGQAGQGAAIGAGTGLLFGSAAGSNAYGYSSYEAQRRYDMAYVQCMYARGNQLPGQVAYRAPPPSSTAPAYPPPNYPAPNLSQGSAPARTAAPRAVPPSGSNVPPGYGVPPGPIAPGPLAPGAPPADYPPSSYPPPNTPPPPGLT